MKFATDENVLKTYNYASVGKLSETLTVTNKRVILTTEGKMPDGSAMHATEELKINSIEKVASTVASKRNGFLLFLAIIFGAAAIAGFVALQGAMQMAAGIGGLVVALIFIIAFALSKRVSFFVELTTGCHKGMSIYDSVGSLTIKRTKKKIKIKVEEKIAIEIIDEIGALIIEGNN
jgi:hypothetical protein